MATIHVVPIEDVVEHYVPGGTAEALAKHGSPVEGWLMVESLPEPGDDEVGCVCGPAVELVPSPGGDGWLISHAALDGREIVERRNARPGGG